MQTRVLPARHPRATADAHRAHAAARAGRRDVARRVLCGITALMALFTGISLLSAQPSASELFEALTVAPLLRAGLGGVVALLGIGMVWPSSARASAAALAVTSGAGIALHLAWGLEAAAAFLALFLVVSLASFALTKRAY